MKKIYIAYGSNLNLSQMERRCPTATLSGIGTLENCKLDFRCMSSQAYATIHPEKGSFVPVAFWEIDSAAERALDIYEGYPRFYYKQTLPVTLSDGTEKEAMVYIMNSKAVPGLPSCHYIQTIHQGYLDVGLNVDILDDICRECGFNLYSML